MHLERRRRKRYAQANIEKNQGISLRYQLGGNDNFVQEVAQFGLHHLAVPQLRTQGERLVLQNLNFRADAAQVRLKASKQGLHVGQNVIANLLERKK